MRKIVKKGKAEMEKNKIIELEKIVEELGDSYDLPNENIVKKLNELTGLNWKDEDYFDYCSEYWSHDSLEETVFALLNNGDYPDKKVKEMYFIKVTNGTDMSFTKENIAKILKGESLERLDDLQNVNPEDIVSIIINDIQKLKYNQKDYEKFIDKRKSKITLFKEKNDEYGYEQNIRVAVYNDKIVKILFQNIQDSIYEMAKKIFDNKEFLIIC